MREETMSAIAGIYHLNEEPVNLEHGRRIMKSLEKFPADDIQTWHNEKVFLGCHAQWITPESIGEKLPYYNEQKRLAITADAIIDNREELFEKLQVDRSRQKGITDSELILLAYEKWGEDSPKFLVGDFAFMIWDERERKMFGARDASGYRTLYYYHDQSRFAFCTTIEPLLSLPYIEEKLNEDYIAEFLAIAGPIDTLDAKITPFRKIDQLPPFHAIKVTKKDIKINKYGSFYSEKPLRLKSDEEYIEAFQDIFQKAVTSRLRTYHNVGSLLSGGLDSGSVVGFAAKTLQKENKTLHTFSYIPPKDFVDFTPNQLMPDERPFIKKTVQYVGGISDNYYDFEGRSSYSEVDDMLEALETPYKFLENSFWLKGIFEKANDKGLGILLCGDVGNFTISWGAPLNYYAILLKKLKWFRLFNELDQFSRNIGGARLRRLPHIARIGFPFVNQLLTRGTLAKPNLLINPEFADKTGVFQKLKAHGFDESGWFASSNIYAHRKILFENIFPWNAGNTLNSKLSLRYSLWKRDPTNDIRVVRFCLSLPEDQYVQNGFGRSLIRRATEKILPDDVRLNQVIRGVQGADWIHRMTPHWDQYIKEVKQLSRDKRILEFINSKLIHSAIANAEEGPKLTFSISDNSLLMRCLILYRYLKRFN